MTPEKGFYYHYKHDSELSVNNYAYEVIGVGLHTEGDHGKVNPKDMLVVYRPIYNAFTYKMGRMFDVRPLEMFMEKVVKDGKEIERFIKISDPEVISELEKIRDEMYERPN